MADPLASFCGLTNRVDYARMRPATADIPLQELNNSEDVGLGFACRSATLLMIIPGVQKAHWKAPHREKPAAQDAGGLLFPAFDVVIDFPLLR